jgi:hypothetical protein
MAHKELQTAWVLYLYDKTTSFKYNTTRYFWWLDGYIYSPNIEWETLKLEGVFNSDITKDGIVIPQSDDCTPRYEQPIYIPEALFAEIEGQVIQTMMGTLQIPSERF